MKTIGNRLYRELRYNIMINIRNDYWYRNGSTIWRRIVLPLTKFDEIDLSIRNNIRDNIRDNKKGQENPALKSLRLRT